MGVGIVAPPAGGGVMGARWVTGSSFPFEISPLYEESGPPGTLSSAPTSEKQE